jgi:hypothetical protein
VTEHAKHACETGDGALDTGDQGNPHSDQHTEARGLWGGLEERPFARGGRQPWWITIEDLD